MHRQKSKSSSYKIIHGDSTKKSTLRKDTVDITITSPPYNVGLEYDNTDDTITYDAYLKFTRKWLSNVFHWTKSTGRLCLNVGLDKNKNGKRPVCADITRLALEVGWKYHATVIWNEGNISRRTAWGSWLSASAPHVIAPVEVILILYKDEWKRNKSGITTITKEQFMEYVLGMWTFNGSKKNGHIAPFPPELPKRCIRLFSYEDDVILDPFVGSGTTVLESLDNNRQSVGIDISKEYCGLAKKRIHEEMCQTKLLNEI